MELLLAAFKVLDPKNLGYVKEDVLHNLLTTKGYFNLELNLINPFIKILKTMHVIKQGN